MFSENDAAAAIGATAYGSDSEKIGKVGQVFLDDHTGQPDFLTVNTGFFGTSESFVPTEGAAFDGEKVSLAFAKHQVKDAPKVDLEGGHLDHDEERRLFEYYGMSASYDAEPQVPAVSNGTSGDVGLEPVGHDTSGPTTDEAMTRSEEHLEVRVAQREAGRARLRKYVTTEQETITVPVRKERAVLVSEPITETNAGDSLDGPSISEEEHEVVLTEERAVVETVAVPVERVRLGIETVNEEETVTSEVRKENIDVEGDVDQRP